MRTFLVTDQQTSKKETAHFIEFAVKAFQIAYIYSSGN